MRDLVGTALLMGAVLVAGCSDQSPIQLDGPDDLSPQEAHAVRGDAELNQKLADVRRATAQFNDLEAAEEAGYNLALHCEANPAGPGAMGMHAVNQDLVGDGEVNPLEPEVLVYMPRGEGFELVAVEYFAIEGPFSEAPSLFGETFVDHTENPHGLPPHFELHAWTWHHNPDGMFAQWNPNLTCPEDGEHENGHDH